MFAVALVLVINWKECKLKKPLIFPSIFLKFLRKLQNSMIRITGVQINAWDILYMKQKCISTVRLLCTSVQSMVRDPGNKDVPAYPESGLQHAFCIMVSNHVTFQ